MSAVLHCVALALAVSLRFATPVATVQATPTRLVLVSAPRVTPPRVIPPRVVPPQVVAVAAAHRAFVAPAVAAAERRIVARIEAALPEQAATPLPLVESHAPTVLPPPPIVVGKLAGATVAEVSSAPQAALRTTSFGTAAAAPEPELVRAPKTSGFGSASVATEVRSRSAPVHAAITAVEILAKPRPLYTEEARRLKIEGEVLLEVLFGASGTAQVQRVVRGLGHGLDESAAASVAEIRFRPAQRAGQAVDQTATVHITFQLAY